MVPLVLTHALIGPVRKIGQRKLRRFGEERARHSDSMVFDRIGGRSLTRGLREAVEFLDRADAEFVLL